MTGKKDGKPLKLLRFSQILKLKSRKNGKEPCVKEVLTTLSTH